MTRLGESGRQHRGSLGGELLDLQHEILEMIATGETLSAAMDRLCRRAEEIAPAVTCSILTVDTVGTIHPLAAPSLPDSYSRALDGVHIGPGVGSCGTAAFRGEPVEVTDIETDPLWTDFRALALPIGLRACWSSPIKARDGRVIGTFAFYYRTRRGACDVERRIVAACVHLCAIAIEHDMARTQIRRIAYYDPVTGLMNRVAFHDRAIRALSDRASPRRLAVHYIDLDEFKWVNDSLGHRAGDILLDAVGRRIVAETGGALVVARLGGDEFAILQEAGDRAEVAEVAARVLGVFSEPFAIDGHEIRMGASLGIAVAPDDGRSIDELMINADLALYRAKADGRGHHRFFTADLAEAAKARRETERDLRAALDRGEFSMVYQPIVRFSDGTVTACEALLRWRHPQRGIVSPATFIPLAEEIGLITRIGAWVLREACRQAVDWPGEVALSVNLSPLQLRNPALVADIMQALAETGFPPARLILEITETAILADEAASRDALTRLASMGIRIALDDFGTGYSSLWSLRAFPINKIKIDRSFVHELAGATPSGPIVRTVIALARDLGMTTTAEGIENDAQASLLAAEGCTEGQGYHFAPPLPPAEVRTLLDVRDGRWRPGPVKTLRAVGGS